MFTKRETEVKFETKRRLKVTVSASVFLSSKSSLSTVIIGIEYIFGLIPK